jgi:hypothetical protein
MRPRPGDQFGSGGTLRYGPAVRCPLLAVDQPRVEGSYVDGKGPIGRASRFGTGDRLRLNSL